MSDEQDEDDDAVGTEQEPALQYYGCVLCSAVTLSAKVGDHRDADDREKLCHGELKKYADRYNRFVADMQEEGFKVEHYAGRCYYNGPAVRVDQYEDPDDVVRATKVKIQRDSMGLGKILYPR